jgi:hypothetical protein
MTWWLRLASFVTCNLVHALFSSTSRLRLSKKQSIFFAASRLRLRTFIFNNFKPPARLVLCIIGVDDVIYFHQVAGFVRRAIGAPCPRQTTLSDCCGARKSG